MCSNPGKLNPTFSGLRANIFHGKFHQYRKWSNKPPGAYLSKWVLGEGAYSRGGGGGKREGAYKMMQKSSVQK